MVVHAWGTNRMQEVTMEADSNESPPYRSMRGPLSHGVPLPGAELMRPETSQLRASHTV